MKQRPDLLAATAVLARAAGQGFEIVDGGGHVAHRAACETELLEEPEPRQEARRLGKSGGDVTRPREIADRFAVGVPPQRGARRELQVPHRALIVAGFPEVRGQLRGDVAHAVAVARLLALADRLVKLAPPGGREALVERVAVQGVHEPVACRHRPVRPLTRAVRAEEQLALRQVVQPLLHVRQLPLDRGGHRGRRKLHAHHAARLEEALLIPTDPADLPLDHLAEALGDVQLDLFERARQAPTCAPACAMRPRASRSSSMVTMNRGLPSVRRWMTRASSRGKALSGNRSPR